jgi:hypothetical protein
VIVLKYHLLNNECVGLLEVEVSGLRIEGERIDGE